MYSRKAAESYALALQRVYRQAEPTEAERAVLDQFADRSALAAIQENLGPFMMRTGWSQIISARIPGLLDRGAGNIDRMPDDEWDALAALTAEAAFWNTESDEHGGETALTEAAADPTVPPETAKRVSDWSEHVHYGLWLLHPQQERTDLGDYTRLLTGVTGWERRWLDEKVSRLGGLTPREATAAPAARIPLESLLREYEYHAALSKAAGNPPPTSPGSAPNWPWHPRLRPCDALPAAPAVPALAASLPLVRTQSKAVSAVVWHPRAIQA